MSTTVYPNPDHFALVIGIDHYPQLRPLRAAVRDAARFSEWLVKPEGGGLPPDNITYIRSQPLPPGTAALGAHPNQLDVTQAMMDMHMHESRKLGKRLYFYFAGHGFGPNFQEVGMVLTNASKTTLGFNLGLTLYREFFYETALFDEVVYVIDCCRDPIRYVAPVGPAITFEKSNLPQVVKEFGVLGAAWGEEAFEVNALGDEPRGLLTQAVLEALDGIEGARETNGSGNVTDQSLWRYVSSRVPELAVASALPQIQTPQSLPMGAPLVLTSILRASQQATVNVLVLPGFVGKLVVLHPNAATTLHSKTIAAGEVPEPWVLPLPAGYIYSIEVTPSAGDSALVPIDTRNKAGQTVNVQL